MRTALHVHTENSLKECGLKIDDMLKKAKSLGYDKVILGDICNMTGAVEFCNKAKQQDITPVLGVECLLMEEDDVSRILLVAKNHDGYVSLCRLVTKANENLTNDGKAVLSKEELAQYASENLIACCGGMNGFVSYPFIRNQKYKNIAASIPDVQVQESNSSYHDTQMQEIKEALKERRAEKKDLQNQMKSKKASYAFFDDAPDDVENAVDIVELKERLKKTENEIARFSRMEKAVKKQMDAVSKTEGKLQKDLALKIHMKEKILSSNALLDEMKERLSWLIDLFGQNLGVEVILHKEPDEDELNTLLLKVAEELHVMPVLGLDSYTLDGSDEEVLKWHLVKSLQDNEWVPVGASSSYYGMEQAEELIKRANGGFTKEQMKVFADNTDLLFQDCSMRFDKDEHYPKYKVPSGMTATQLMEKRARAAIPRLYGKDGWTKDREAELQKEIAVIDKTGYSDYTLTIADILNDARKMADPEVVSCLVGPGRGSGAGSIVNYLMGITSLDPVTYGLIFERYLNIERVSPPDIDSDIATSIRDDLVLLIKGKYKKKDGCVGVCGILTKSKLTGKAAIRAAGRILSHKIYGNTTALYSLSDKMSKTLPADPKLKLSDHAEELREAYTSKEAKELLRYALMLEGTVQAYGTHAAGVIISDSGDITDYAPLINIGTAEEPVWNIQYDMVESESIGLLKMDMLGLSTLDICYTALKLIYAGYGKKIDLFRIPFEKEVFREIYSKGATNGVFQCESAGMKRMWMDLKPEGIEDIIAGIALYRPGPMDFIPDYIKGKENPASIRYKTEKLRPILEKTYGCIVYQEQVMQIVRDLAGYSMGRSDLVRRAMSKKKADVMAQERKNFVYGNPEEGITGCVGNGIPADVADSIYDDMVDFAKYAFNKSHAAAYALVSYQTAWLKYHYPKEFMVGAMDVAARQNAPDKLPGLLHECKQMGIKVLPPDINRSEEGFSIVDDNILYGLWAIKGVKENASVVLKTRDSIYRNFKDFLLRCPANKASIRNLIKAGAFTYLCKSRGGMLGSLDVLLDMRKKIWDTQQKIEASEKILREEMLTVTKRRTEQAKLERAESALYTLTNEFEALPVPVITDTIEKKLEYEKETLYAYVTAHPLDAYDERPGCTCLGSITEVDIGAKGVEVMGCISGFKEVKRKKDGKPMAVFTLEDKTGDRKCICYSAKYEEYKKALSDGYVIYAFCNVNADMNDAEMPLLSINYAKIVTPELGPIVYSTPEKDIPLSRMAVEPYLVEQGHPLLWHISDGLRAGILVDTGLFVSHSIIDDMGEDFVQEAEFVHLKKRRRVQ